MNVNKVLDAFNSKRYLISMGAGSISKMLNVSKEDVFKARKIYRNKKNYGTEYHPKDVVFKQSKNVLVIGDTHIPYEKEGYLEFCVEQYVKYNCDSVVHIGDLIDSHATSFHPSVPEAYSAGDELKHAKKKLQKWYKAFPNMLVVRGNHDDRPYRIASGMGIASSWLRSFTKVLGVPNWEYQESYTINNTFFTHGTGTSGVTAAYRRALNLGQNVVIGHLHSEASIMYHKLPDKTIWGMIVGCGVDEDSYGMQYAKNFPKKSIISCAVISGNQPIIITMP